MHQGCPLSPLLYVLCIEILAVNIRTSPNVTGVYLPDSIEQYKCSGYADDTTIAVTTDESIEEVFSIYDTFEKASSTKLNRGKSKGMWLGAWKSRNDTPFGLSWVKELPLLGASFSVGDYTIPTWEKPVARLESRFSAWSGCSLSLQGKATIIKVLALLQIWHLCHVFAIPAWASKRITKALWSFFWSGKKYLVAHTTVCLPKSRGGFGVIDFERKAFSPLLPPGMPLSQPGSPSLVSSCWSNDPLTTPSFQLGSVRSPSSSEASFYALSLAPSFQEGGSDHYFSDGDGAPSPTALSDVSASVEQPGVLAIQDADQAPVGPSL